jgi:replication factor C subunit 3/5
MLWVDKYRPKTLDKVTVHDQVAQNLRKLVSLPAICASPG